MLSKFKERIKLTKSTNKGQFISKAIYGLLTSPKKRTEEFVWLLFYSNKSNPSVCLLGESTARQSAFRFYLTFSKVIAEIRSSKSNICLKCESNLEREYMFLVVTNIIPGMEKLEQLF